MQIERLVSGLGLDEGGGVRIKALGIGDEGLDTYGSNLRIETPSAPQGSNIYFQAGGAEQFIIFQNEVVSSVKHGFYNGINSITTAGNTFEGPITGVTATFIGLLSASKGISASGGVTFSGTFSGATGSFSRLLTASAGISASGATFSGDIAVNGGDITTTSATATVFNTTATNLSIGSAATTWTVGATSGTATIRNPGVVLGNSSTTTISTPISSTNNLYITPNGDLILAPSSDAAAEGTRTEIIITNYPDAAGQIQVNGGDLYLGVKSTDGLSTTPVNIIFEGATDNTNETTLTVVDPTASRTITFPDASGTVALTSSTVASFNGTTGAVTGVSRFNGLTGGVTLAAGTNITLTPVGNTITIASSGGGGGGSSVYGVTASLDFSENINGIEIVFYGLGNDYSTSLKYIENDTLSYINLTTNSIGSFYGTFTSIKSFYDATNGWSAKLLLKPPFTDVGNPLITTTAGSIYADGIVTLFFTPSSIGNEDNWNSFVSTTLYHQEETYVTKTLTGITWVTDSMFLSCKVLGLTSADHTPEDAILEGVNFEINNILGGTGFDIIGHAPEGTYGKYTIKCLGQ